MDADSSLGFEKQNLLNRESRDEDIYQRAITKDKSALGISRKSIITHVILTTLYISLTVLYFLQRPSTKLHLPAVDIVKDAIEWETQFFEVDIGRANSPYQGPPSREIDIAWHNLFEHSNLRISAEELAQMNKTSIPLGDNSGYFGNLDVHHQLHCLKFLRWYVYPDYYDFRLNKTTTMHADHCIENLRRNIMCIPSLELLLFDWKADRVAPKPRFSYEHTCVNWDRINAWTRERSFDVFKENALSKNPILDPTLVVEEEQEG